MSIELSTGLRNGMLNATGLKEAFTNGVLDLYSGAQPSSADDSIGSATLLCRITVGGGAFTAGTATNGINFGDPAAGVIAKSTSETWQGNAVAAGQIGWFRLKGNAADADGTSTSLSRIDGSVGTTGADLNLASIVVEEDTPISISVFQFTQPAED